MENIGYLIKIIRFLTAAAYFFCNLPYKIKEKSNKLSFFPRTNSVFKTPARIFMWGVQVSQALRVCLALFFTFASGVLFDHSRLLGLHKNTGCFAVHKVGVGGYCQRVWSGNPHPFSNQRNPQICYPIPDLTVKILYICCVKDLIWVSRKM